MLNSQLRCFYFLSTATAGLHYHAQPPVHFFLLDFLQRALDTLFVFELPIDLIPSPLGLQMTFLPQLTFQSKVHPPKCSTAGSWLLFQQHFLFHPEGEL